MNKSKFMQKISELFDEVERDGCDRFNPLLQLSGDEGRLIVDAHHKVRQMAYRRGVPWDMACDLVDAAFRAIGGGR